MSTTTTARISSDLILVTFYQNILTVQITGYEDVLALQNKALIFEGRTFQFSGWNSDTNEAYFRPSAAFARLA